MPPDNGTATLAAAIKAALDRIEKNGKIHLDGTAYHLVEPADLNLLTGHMERLNG